MRKSVLQACAAERDSTEEMTFALKEGKKETNGRTKMWPNRETALLSVR